MRRMLLSEVLLLGCFDAILAERLNRALQGLGDSSNATKPVGAWASGPPRKQPEPSTITSVANEQSPTSTDASPLKPGGAWGAGPPKLTPSKGSEHRGFPAKAGQLDTINIMTWNVKNLGRNSLGTQEDFVKSALRQMHKQHKPAVVVMQEVEGCGYVNNMLIGFACVESTVPERIEGKMPGLVLGNVILFDTNLFTATHANRVLTDEGLTEHAEDDSGRSLREHHHTLCSWSAYNGCRRVQDDMPRPTSVRLAFQSGVWPSKLVAAFPGGIRIVDIHLFAGARVGGISESAKADRRGFQMRSLFALVRRWNQRMLDPPTTIYAGDFNTRGATELARVVASANDYGAQLWCAADGGRCGRVRARHRTHLKGYLDNVVVDVQPRGNLAGATSFASVIKQPQGPVSVRSDHEPLLVRLRVSAAQRKPDKKLDNSADSWPTLR